MPWCLVWKRIYTENSPVTDMSSWDGVWDCNRPRFELDFSLLNFHKQLFFEMFPKIDWFTFPFFFLDPILAIEVLKYLVLTSSSEISLEQILSWHLIIPELAFHFWMQLISDLIFIWGFQCNCRCTTMYECVHTNTQDTHRQTDTKRLFCFF